MSDDEKAPSQLRLIDEVFAPLRRLNEAAAEAQGAEPDWEFRFATAMACECGPEESCRGCATPPLPPSPVPPPRRFPFGSPPPIVRRPRPRRKDRAKLDAIRALSEAGIRGRDAHAYMLEVLNNLPRPSPGFQRTVSVFYDRPTVEAVGGDSLPPVPDTGGAEAPQPSSPASPEREQPQQDP